MNIKEQYEGLKKALGKSDKDFASAFGYSTVHSFRNAARYEQIISGIVYTYNLSLSQRTVEQV